MLIECELSLFAVEGTRDYGLLVAQHLELVLDEHEERAFEDANIRYARSPKSADTMYL